MSKPADADDGLALEWKERGNSYYSKREYAKAAQAYQWGFDALTNNDNDTKKESSSLALALRSNLAMVLLKLEDYERADQECTRILQVHPTNTKVLYRRALAREGHTVVTEDDNNIFSPLEQLAGLTKAMDDLQQCLAILDSALVEQQPDKHKMREACRSALDRLEKSYYQLEQQQQQQQPQPQQQPHQRSKLAPAPAPKRDKRTNGITTNEELSPRSKAPPVASVAQQKKDVLRLLLARQSAAAGATRKGEAFFLLDWKWWCQWCRHVDFFDQQQQDAPSKDKMDRILKLLPPGSSLPELKEQKDDTDDDDSSTDSDSQILLGPPQAIDNSRLLVDKSIFSKQWYDSNTLRPNLVRGYHFELLPREVYNALRSWYGEATHSVCRRTTHNKIVVLYPRPEAQVSPAKPPQKCSACRAPGATSRCKRCMSAQYCDRGCQEAHWPFHKNICKNSKTNGHVSRLEGRVGLNNLGNTCFMNSALQCLSHATPLTRHFLSNKFQEDVNTSNALGTGGKLANAYDSVLKELWMRNKGTAMSPTALKRAIALFAPRFAGCLQHDAQEFLAYLLDGLHEDLNRIRKAPYVELPDVTDGHNMAIAGAEAWDAHKRRNDSLVMDTFYGQFQSTCICPKCDRVSVSFDAFNHVSLEIPRSHNLTITIPVLVFRAANGEMPHRYGVTLSRQSLMADLKRGLADLTGVPPNRLILCDVYENTIYELLHDKKPIAKIRPNDMLTAYEVDPYTNTSIHVVATHSLLVIDHDGKEQRPPFGFPFMTSFHAEASCQQVWEHTWKIIDHIVCQEGRGKGYVDARNKYRREDVLTVRVVNSQGQPLELFPGPDGSTTSIVPFESPDKIRDHLGKDCTESFLFLALDWKKTAQEEDEDQVINPKSFVAYADHKSLVEAIRKQRNQNSAKGVSLDQCFETFTKPERLDEHNMWYCSKCKEHVRALKTMKLWRLPNILVVHLKRFEFKHALRRVKLDTFVDFPLEGLDMDLHCAKWKSTAEGDSKAFVNASVPAEYDLFAVVNHYGRMGFGHYTAFARQWGESGASKEWALFDDSSVRPVGGGEGPDGVVGPAAYVLFYRRRAFN